MSKNEHTGQKQQTKPVTDAFRDNFDSIFRKTKEEILLKGCSNEACFCTGECKEPLTSPGIKISLDKMD